MDFLAEQRQKIKVQLEETLKQLDVANCCVKKVNMELQESKDKHHLLSREIDDKNSRIEHLQGERVHLKEEINAHEKKYLESSAAIDEVNARLHSNENDTKVLKGQRDELKNVLQSELKVLALSFIKGPLTCWRNFLRLVNNGKKLYILIPFFLLYEAHGGEVMILTKFHNAWGICDHPGKNKINGKAAHAIASRFFSWS
jgi:FtsZ-binding cell division protein ZapB